MTEKQFDFSIRMDNEDSIPNSEPIDFSVRPDTKGPKTVAILMFLGGLLLVVLAYGDFQLSQLSDLSQQEIDMILETPNNDVETEITTEDYQDFHDAARNGYLLRSVGLLVSGVLLIIGAPILFKLNKKGAHLGLLGATIGLTIGIAGSMLVNDAAGQYLSGPLILTYKILMYLCGVCMFICGALTSLPLLNARARMALNGSNKVRISSIAELESE
jgi:hypothetical protein